MFSHNDWLEMINQCEELLNCITIVGKEESRLTEDQDQIRRIVRKMFIASVLEGQNVVAVTGLQGSGKTTLVKGFYGLSDEFMAATEARGERLPILVTEDDVQEPVMRRQALNWAEDRNSWSAYPEQITAKELKLLAADGGDTGTMLLELHIPRTHPKAFPALLLLPGFENVQDVHEDLIEFSVSCVGTCIYVVSKNLHASDAHRKCEDKLSKLFEGRKPIYALSFSNTTDDYNGQFRTNIAQAQGAEKDQVICFGKDDGQKWIKPLEDAIWKYAYSSAQATQAQQRYLLGSLQEDVKTMAHIAEYYQKQIEITDTLTDDPYLTKLRENFKKERKIIAENVRKAMDARASDSLSYLEELWSKDGLLKTLKSVGRCLLGPSVKDIVESENLIKTAILGKNIKSNASGIEYCRDAYITGTDKSLKKLENTMEQFPLTSQTSHNMMVLLTWGKPGGTQGLLAEGSIIPALDAIPKVASHTFLSILDQGFQRVDLPLDGFTEEIKDVLKEARRGGAEGQRTLLAMLGITGIDFIPDQKMDLIPELADVLGISTGWAAAGVITAAAAGAALEVWRIGNKRDVTNFFAARDAIQSFYRDRANDYMNFYDKGCNEICQRVERALVDIYNVDRNTATKLNIYITIKELGDTYDKLVKQISRKKYELRNIVAG